MAGTQVAITYGRIGDERPDQGQRVRRPGQGARPWPRRRSARRSARATRPPSRGVRQRSARSPAAAIASSRSTAQQAPGAVAFRQRRRRLRHLRRRGALLGRQRARRRLHRSPTTARSRNRYRLPEGVKCIVADDFWIYAGCDDGKVYDLSGKVPRAAYEIAADVDIYWLDIHDGVLGVSDGAGRITTIDHEDEFQWARTGRGDSALDGPVRRDRRLPRPLQRRGPLRRGGRHAASGRARSSDAVLFGWQEEHAVYAGTARRSVHRLAKSDGRVEAVYRCDGAVYSLRHLAGRPLRLRGRQPLLGLLLRRRRRAAVEARHRLRLGLLHAVPRRPALHRHHRRLAGLHRRERGRDHGGPRGHRAASGWT